MIADPKWWNEAEQSLAASSTRGRAETEASHDAELATTEQMRSLLGPTDDPEKIGESNRVTSAELSTTLSKIKSLDDNEKTLKRTLAHLESNGVDTNVAVLSLGPQLIFDPVAERFTNRDAANQLLSREYRKGFEVVEASKI